MVMDAHTSGGGQPNKVVMSTNGGGASSPLPKRGKGRPRKIHTVGS